ncbi:hypothetical protein FXE88_08405 [Vibrio cholerae]|uniref:hypothetical protein n=1 Tax=Vibrio cholerae TaxID=666 RepID=UPI0011DADF98|nr:hypothetical protein [Vibrio cholerae]TXY62610.1 hypothetical protein FXE88_08405 [Vibrio cholerae]GHX20459.1 phage integrase [Vibrio cholerae]GHX35657.1 phage integrase [Vibrio cholerae]
MRSSSVVRKLNIDGLNAPITFDEHNNPLSYIYDLVWDFSNTKSFKISDSGKINFSYIPVKYRDKVQSLLAAIYKGGYISSLSGVITSRTHIINILSNIEDNEITNIDDDRCFRNFKSKIKDMNLSRSYIETMFGIINKLHDLEIVNKVISSPKNEAKKLSNKSVNQAICIPESLAFRIYSIAIDIIERYHPYRKEISEAYDNYFNILTQHKLEGKDTKHFRRDVGSKINHSVGVEEFKLEGQAIVAREIQVACYLITLAFSGVRKSEGLSLNYNSYYEKNYKGFKVSFISGESTKGRTAGVPSIETWVCHPIVKKALELAYEMSNFARKRYEELYKTDHIKLRQCESSFINLSLENQKDGVLAGTFNTSFMKFLKDFDLSANEDDIIEFEILNPNRLGELSLGGYLPKLSHHDFRRTFAVFVVRNKLGNVMTIKEQYKHTNIIMSNWYANNSHMARDMDMELDLELQELMDQANIFVTTNVLFDIYNSETLSGVRGKEIMNERIDGTYKGTYFISREDIEERVRNNNISIVEHPTGYCFNPSCDRICSSDRSSKTCKHEVITYDKALERSKFRERLIKRFNALNDGSSYMGNILADILLKIQTIEEVLIDHGISFIPFDSSIKSN